MARLILSLDGQTLAEYNMTKERYTVGRLPDNDIRIDNAAVSGHHSLIINILNDSFLEDLNSTNGTYVNGKLIKKHALQQGDVITVGHHQLRYVDDQSDALSDILCDWADTATSENIDGVDALDGLPDLPQRNPDPIFSSKICNARKDFPGDIKHFSRSWVQRSGPVGYFRPAGTDTGEF